MLLSVINKNYSRIRNIIYFTSVTYNLSISKIDVKFKIPKAE